MKISVSRLNADATTAFAIEFDNKTFDIEIEYPSLSVNNYDFAVWPLLLYAMKHGLPIEIDEPVSADLQFNVDILKSFLSRHQKLVPIEVRPTRPLPVARGYLPGNIIPFSGGVDSCFTLLYHHFELRRKIDLAMMVKGLDLSDEREFALACDRNRSILSLTGTASIQLRTNIRERFKPAGWKLHSDFVLAGFLHLFHTLCGHAFISGEGDAGLLAVRECFETPFLNERLFFLFGNDTMLIQNFEGANHTKTQKVAFIARFPEIRTYLRVCWESRHHSNCGHCTKCIMTQLAFIAVIGSVPPCFPAPANESDVRGLLHSIRESKASDPDSPAVILPKEFFDILRTAALNNIRHPLLELIKGAEAPMDRASTALV